MGCVHVSYPNRFIANGPVTRPDRTVAERQRRKRDRLSARGFVQCNVWVPEGVIADIKLMAEIIRAYPHLSVGPLRDTISGKLVALRTRSVCRVP